MSFPGVNVLAIVIAAVAGFLIGAVWYMALSRPWLRAARLDPATMKPTATPFIVSFIAELVMATMLAGVIGHLGVTGAWPGIVSGFFLWLGFVATTLAVNHRYQGYGWDLTLIDAGHWLAVLMAMGAIIGWFGA